ncbi:hypothetical protein IEQ34_011653 [Dendrobium chrysotoxum]|uniref:Uncharacterized protein n=1 Tax=Dendrobium chrysotoxum TaxID=161865 RepID=A0AAV7GTG6_DENCH|nr:hypothetical protein IEQ34_011653 [Dendrobium chrysotoxum]
MIGERKEKVVCFSFLLVCHFSGLRRPSRASREVVLKVSLKKLLRLLWGRRIGSYDGSLLAAKFLPQTCAQLKMDARHSLEIRKHLDEQSRILLESYRTMSHELHNLQVEEEMLMRKLYEHMLAEGLIKKKQGEPPSRKDVDSSS